MDYRLATAADLPRLAEMRWDFCSEDYPEQEMTGKEAFIAACLDWLRWGVAEGNWHYWLAEEDGLIVANIFVHLIRTVPRPDRLDRIYGYITNVYTRPQYRNRGRVREILVRPIDGTPCVPRRYYDKGVGGELLERVTEWAAAQDLELLFLWPSERSVPFYQRAGFVPSTDLLELYLTTE